MTTQTQASYNYLDDRTACGPQPALDTLQAIADAGFRHVLLFRPDGEAAGQPKFEAFAAAAASAGLEAHHLPVVPGRFEAETVAAAGRLFEQCDGPIYACCASGRRAATVWALARTDLPRAERCARTERLGISVAGLLDAEPANRVDDLPPRSDVVTRHAVIIVGGGAAGLATAASLRARDRHLELVIVDPSDTHRYQPGWTLVGAGVFEPEETLRPMASVLPKDVVHLKDSVVSFQPAQRRITLASGRQLAYDQLVVAPGIELNFGAIDGLEDALGSHGVTSNYRIDLAPYTYRLVSELKGGRALFTQPPMPIKCAGAPQKAMYLASDYWQTHGRLANIDIEFHNAGPVLFGVKDYVPALMEYVERYGIDLNFGSRLIAVDGPTRRATFQATDAEGKVRETERDFDMLHVCPPQRAPEFIRSSALVDEAGWVDVDPATLQHTRYPDIFALGDACNSPNAKTAAAARKQAPVVACNVLAARAGVPLPKAYDGYGSCPLTVERGRVVLAEFGYGGKLMPSFPSWLLDGRRPTRMAWWLKERLLPPLYWHGMLKGREWLARPCDLTDAGA